jgi:hypothetical protein
MGVFCEKLGGFHILFLGGKLIVTPPSKNKTVGQVDRFLVLRVSLRSQYS